MDAFEVVADAVRRRILELLADGERTAGAVTAAISTEFGITQPAVSQHLKVLRDNGFATVRAEGTRRLYAVDPAGLAAMSAWLERFRPVLAQALFTQRLDALETELVRGRRARGTAAGDARTGEQTVRKKETA